MDRTAVGTPSDPAVTDTDLPQRRPGATMPEAKQSDAPEGGWFGAGAPGSSEVPVVADDESFMPKPFVPAKKAAEKSAPTGLPAGRRRG